MNPLWTQLAAQADLAIDESHASLLTRYLDLLLQANQVLNLTRIDDPASAQILHIGDALTLLPFLPKHPHRLADVGTGGGVPGIPLAIVRPDIEVTLIESIQKKAAFLIDAVRTLALENVKVSPDRAEAIAHGPLRESFDVVTARAVARMEVLVEWCLPLVKKHGKFLAMKGAKISEELPAAEKAIRILNGHPPIVHPVQLPGADNHVIVEIVKAGKTDAKYPRR